ncbi:MAG: hypothetical protein FJW39_30365 [Acidobacteria bacterium]|nr:hypothetical protein [Acidobacteriota bacterium]
MGGPVVVLAWNRIPCDNGSNTRYRLFVQDMARSGPALDFSTTNNFYAANFAASGRRYDGLVISTQNGAESQRSDARSHLHRGRTPSPASLPHSESA